MEKITQREIYSNNFFEFCNKVELNDEFIQELKNHRYFQNDMETVLKFQDVIARKVYILLEFTRLRSTCEEVIKLLRSSGQTEAADELENYNKSPGRMKVTSQVSLKVIESKAEMKGSLIYQMIKKPRGKCIIINNVPKEVHMESKRFESVFQQLLFEVELWDSLTSEKMREKLKLLSEEKSLQKHEAFIVMVISHGVEEKVLGYNACQNEDSTDLIEIKEIVDIFSEKNCTVLRQTPKLFFFTCCRELQSTEESINEIPNFRVNTFYVKHENRVYPQLKSIDEQWTKENKDTFISYSCSEGYETFIDSSLGITHFGQALSHSIAQYACEENLMSIMSRTCDFMDKNVEQWEERSAPELRGQCMRRQLFFNPGFPK